MKNFLLRRFNEINLLLYGMLFSAASLLVLLVLSKNVFLVVASLILFTFGLAGTFPLTTAIAYNKNPRYSGSMSSTMFTAAYLGAIIFQYVVGFTLNSFGTRAFAFMEMSLCFAALLSITLLKISAHETAKHKIYQLPPL